MSVSDGSLAVILEALLVLALEMQIKGSRSENPGPGRETLWGPG
jgi:hypothetical protein